MIMSVAACLLAGCGDPLQAGQVGTPGVVQASVAETPTECREVTFTITSHDTVEGQWPDSTCQEGLTVIAGAPMEWRQLEDRRLRMIVRYVNLTGVPVRLPLDVMLPVGSKTPLDPHTAAAGTMVPLEYDSLGGHGETWWALAGPAGVLGVGDTSRVDTLLFQIHEPVLSARFRFNHYPVEAAIGDTSRPAAPWPGVYPEGEPLLVVDPARPDLTYERTVFHVFFDDSTSGLGVQSFMTRFSARIIGRFTELLPDPNHYLIEIPDPGSEWPQVDSVVAAMRTFPGIRLAGPSGFGSRMRLRSRFPVDSGVSESRAVWFSDDARTWPWRAVRAPLAWACENGMYGTTLTRVAVIDAFFSANGIPQDLGLSLASGGVVSQFTNVPYRLDLNLISGVLNGTLTNHGTMTAGIAAASGDNGSGIAGMIWKSSLRLYSLNHLTASGVPESPRTPTQTLAAALKDAANRNVRVVNLSLGDGNPKDSIDLDLVRTDMKRYLNSGPDRLLVISAGNSNRQITLTDLAKTTDTIFRASDRVAAELMTDSAGTYRDKIIFVSAFGRDGQLWSAGGQGSNVILGEQTQIAAPGDNVVSLVDVNGVQVISGTSAAAPFVAGVATQLWSMDPNLTAADVKRFIIQGARVKRLDPATGDSVPAQAVSGAVFPLDAYGALSLMSAERSGTPICGFSAKLFGPLGSQRISVQRPGGSETISLPSQTRPYHDLSIALGGRKLAVSGFGFMEPGLSSPPAGGTAYELSLSGGSWTRRSLGELFARLYLETDTVDVWRGDGSQPPSGVGLTVTDPGFGFHATIRRNTGTVDNLRLETPLEGPVGSPNVFSFSFSPTGNDVVMDVHDASDACAEIWRIDLASGTPSPVLPASCTPLVPQFGSGVVWAPDGDLFIIAEGHLFLQETALFQKVDSVPRVRFSAHRVSTGPVSGSDTTFTGRFAQMLGFRSPFAPFDFGIPQIDPTGSRMTWREGTYDDATGLRCFLTTRSTVWPYPVISSSEVTIGTNTDVATECVTRVMMNFLDPLRYLP